ncbi:hypothetical protein BYT27DRAFT_7127516 [Phlegmacium glaucopus]|nr:hypothetical protein BYT27DRAFT_7127516 [Phlegmacium glaucopus]
MPPRRSKRFKSAPQDSQELSVSSDNRTPDLDPPKAINTKGLPILPDELYLEILSYYPVSQFRQDPNHSVRRQVLFALSQTSTNLRRFFLCYLWERIEVSRSGHAPIKNRPLALELVRQLEIVTIRDPTLAKYVKVVNVDIGVYSQDSVLTELARCLALFPNLYSVQLKIEKNPSMQQGTIARPFKEYVYENIRTAIVSCNALEFLRSCPQSLYVDTCERNILPSPFWDVVTACCPRIEVAPRRNLIPISRMPGISYEINEIYSRRSYGRCLQELPKPSLESVTSHCGDINFLNLDLQKSPFV